MFYKALGLIVWRVGKRYAKRRFAGYGKVGGGVALFAAALAAGYVITRSPGE